MTIPQLEPLLAMASQLESRADTCDIFDFIHGRVAAAKTPSMGQSVCSQVIELCHPKAWGDRMVSGFDNIEWCNWLSALSQQAENCGQAIYEASRASGARA
jgi:hypothetical protein